MEKIYINCVSEILYRLGIDGHMTIDEISRASELPVGIVREILLDLFEMPFGGIRFDLDGLAEEEDLFDLPEGEIDRKIVWRLDLTGMDRIPTDSLMQDEKALLTSLLGSYNNLEILRPYEKIKTAMLIKGTSRDTDEVFSFRHYLPLRRALLKSRKAQILMKSNNGKPPVLFEIIPLGVVFHSEKNDWYLVYMHKDDEVRTVNFNQIEQVSVLDKRHNCGEFDMKDYLEHCFDLESPDSYKVKVIFQDYGNIIHKVKRRLAQKSKLKVCDDGTVEFTDTLSGIENFKKWIFSFGEGARIVEPRWLAEEQIVEWKKLMDHYENIDRIII